MYSKKRGGRQLRRHVPDVLVAGPEAEDGAAVLLALGVAEPVAHDGRADGTAGRLRETEDEVEHEDQDVAEGGKLVFDVKPDHGVDEEQTHAGAEQAQGENRGGIEGVAKFAVHDISHSVGSYEHRVHGTQQERRESGRKLQFRLDC